MIVAIYVVIAVLVGYITYQSFPKPKDEDDFKPYIRAAIVGIITIILLCIQPYKIERIDAGNVGIKVEMVGDARGVGKYEYKTGWVIFNTWFSKIYEFPTYQQHVEYKEQTVITKGGFQCNIKPSFNYSLNPGDVGDMFTNLRLPIRDVEQRWLQTAIVTTINDVANRWQVDSLFNHRQDFEANIVAEVNKKISRWFTMSQLRTNIVPPEALVKSIEQKTQAIQEVQVAENRKQVKIAEGQMRVAEAKADSAVAVTKAAGEARAIKERQLSLTPLYIEYLKIDKWDGVLPQVASGGSGGSLFISPELKSTKQ